MNETISKLTTELLNKIIFEISKKENKKKIKDQILFPLINLIFKETYPYIIILLIIIILTFICGLITSITLMKSHKKIENINI